MAGDEKRSKKNATRRFGKKHVEQYVRNEAGEYEYTGSWYRYEGDRASWQKTRTRLWIAAGAGLLLTLGIGMFPYQTTRAQFHVYLPYIASLIAQILLVWKLGRISDREGTIKSYVYNETVPQLPRIALVALILHGAQLLAIAVDAVQNVIRTPVGQMAGIVAFLLGASCCCIWTYSLRRQLLFRET